MVYFAMAMALFSDDDYEEVAARLAGTLTSWGCWDDSWSVPTSGGITEARQRLGYEPLRELFWQVAVPVAGQLTRGAFLGSWRLMAIDGFEWDAPDSRENAEAFGYAGAWRGPGGIPQGQGGHRQRVRLPRRGGRGDRPDRGPGQRGAGDGRPGGRHGWKRAGC